MHDWIPVPGTTKARLVDAALREFALRGFEPVAVTEIAGVAGVTVGSLYHHFGSKSGLYDLVRTDVERRLLDRMEGAWSATSHLADAVAVGFDYLVAAGYTRLLAERHPDGTDDAVERFVLARLEPADAPFGALLAAAWRAALAIAPENPGSARAALIRIASAA